MHDLPNAVFGTQDHRNPQKAQERKRGSPPKYAKNFLETSMAASRSEGCCVILV
jgi:hypothetical protein